MMNSKAKLQPLLSKLNIVLMQYQRDRQSESSTSPSHKRNIAKEISMLKRTIRESLEKDIYARYGLSDSNKLLISSSTVSNIEQALLLHVNNGEYIKRILNFITPRELTKNQLMKKAYERLNTRNSNISFLNEKLQRDLKLIHKIDSALFKTGSDTTALHSRERVFDKIQQLYGKYPEAFKKLKRINNANSILSQVITSPNKRNILRKLFVDFTVEKLYLNELVRKMGKIKAKENIVQSIFRLYDGNALSSRAAHNLVREYLQSRLAK